MNPMPVSSERSGSRGYGEAAARQRQQHDNRENDDGRTMKRMRTGDDGEGEELDGWLVSRLFRPSYWRPAMWALVAVVALAATTFGCASLSLSASTLVRVGEVRRELVYIRNLGERVNFLSQRIARSTYHKVDLSCAEAPWCEGVSPLVDDVLCGCKLPYAPDPPPEDVASAKRP